MLVREEKKEKSEELSKLRKSALQVAQILKAKNKPQRKIKNRALIPRLVRKRPTPSNCVFKRPLVLSPSVSKKEMENLSPLSTTMNPRLWGTEKSEALKFLPRDAMGYYVDWVSAVELGLISPRGTIEPGGKDTPPYDLDVLLVANNPNRNNICFPHSIHTYWFNCENCHPEIFIMKRNANPISMTKIIKGEYCGRCHGVVAFHVANNCDRCHNTPKPPPPPYYQFR